MSRFSIPKSLPALNSLQTPQVIGIELNDVDVDRMLTSILELAVKRGNYAVSKTDARDYERYLKALQQSQVAQGFETPDELDVLDGWLRSSVVKMERATKRRDTAQMGFIRPITIMTYRSGLPKTRSRNRLADQLVYQAMALALKQEGVSNTTGAVRELWLDTFGEGVELGESPWHDPRYDGHSVLDIDTLLAIRFLEGFAGSQNLRKIPTDLDPPVPLAVEYIGRDLISLLRHYGPAMPVAEAFGQISALLSLRLFQLPLLTAHHLRSLITGTTTPSSCAALEIYCDFVGRRGTSSDELARMCIVRDLEVMRTFLADRLLVRTLDQSVDLLPQRSSLPEDATGRIAALISLRDTDAMEMALRMQIQQIRLQPDLSDEGRTFINDITESDLKAQEQITSILVEGLRKRGLENQVKWFWSTGGVEKPYGLISGFKRSRASWRYSPTDELLTTIVGMCFVEPSGHRTVPELPIRELLARMQDRFGILVDRPPAEMDTADAGAGAAENRAAFTRRLQLLGCYEGLSDDFSAQYVTRPRKAVIARE